MKFKNSSYAQLDISREVPYLTFPALSKYEFIRHGFSTRLGGVSEGIFSTMNMGCDSAPYPDSEEHIRENYRRMTESIGVSYDSVVISNQVHKTNIRIVKEKDRGKGLLRPRDFEDIDGFITREPNITLVTKYADCVPVYLLDPVRKAIGLIHSGWRGTVAKIGGIAVEEMERHFGCLPGNMIAVIGPSICRDCFEIGDEVAAEFSKAFPENKVELLYSGKNGKFQCDLWSANRLVLKEAGLRSENIHISGVCTCCNDDLLFSHRKTKGKRGSMAAFFALC